MAQMLQGVRDREAQRRRERAQRQVSGYEPGEKGLVMRRYLRCWPLLCLLLSSWSTTVTAQRAQLRMSQAPHFVGMAIEIEITLSQFDEAPTPEVISEQTAGPAPQFLGVNANVSSSIRIVNGQMSQTRTVEHVARFRVTPEKAGRFALGPFVAKQGNKTTRTRTVRVQVKEMPQSDEQKVRLVLPDKPIIVGQRVPVRLEWWISEQLAERAARHVASVPLFENSADFRFVDDETRQSRNALNVETATETLSFPAEIRRDSVNGKKFLVVFSERTMVPLRAGNINVPASTLVFGNCHSMAPRPIWVTASHVKCRTCGQSMKRKSYK